MMRSWWLVIRGSWLETKNGEAARAARDVSNHQPPTTNHSPRSGISLTEVLISMFVLMIGLLGVAALIPAGNHEIAEGNKLETASMIGRSAFRDLNVRGYLRPAGGTAGLNQWRDSSYSSVWDAANPQAPFINTLVPGSTPPNRAAFVAYAIDPLGIIAGYGNKFPYNTSGALFLTRIAPMDLSSANMRTCAQSIFRVDNDLLIEPNTANKELPPTQMWSKDGSNNPLGRNFEGNYSWLATVVSDTEGSALNSRVTVSVAVFQKRLLSTPGAGEMTADGDLSGGGGTGGGEIELRNFVSNASPPPAINGVKPGQWIMLAGNGTRQNTLVNPPVNVTVSYFRWYRVLSANPITGGKQNVTLAGADWPGNATPTAWIFDNIVTVYEKQLSLELSN